MDRRSFFRAFAGAPAVTAAAIAAPAKPEPARAIAQIPRCECGYQFMVTMSHSDGMRPKGDPRPARQFMACANPRCKHHDVAHALPTVELSPADPDLVAAIKRENAQRLKEEMEYRRQRHKFERDFERDFLHLQQRARYPVADYVADYWANITGSR